MKDNRKTDVKSTIQALDQISANTLQMIDESAKNLAKGIENF
ncbi:MAG: hypothetical protein PHF86_09810 [Candidatus Nanoarchaeia archaeon]|nr:hypothetical protein [Candidatus Nanoarchaeia archaeon]